MDNVPLKAFECQDAHYHRLWTFLDSWWVGDVYHEAYHCQQCKHELEVTTQILKEKKLDKEKDEGIMYTCPECGHADEYLWKCTWCGVAYEASGEVKLKEKMEEKVEEKVERKVGQKVGIDLSFRNVDISTIDLVDDWFNALKDRLDPGENNFEKVIEKLDEKLDSEFLRTVIYDLVPYVYARYYGHNLVDVYTIEVKPVVLGLVEVTLGVIGELIGSTEKHTWVVNATVLCKSAFYYRLLDELLTRPEYIDR